MVLASSWIEGVHGFLKRTFPCCLFAKEILLPVCLWNGQADASSGDLRCNEEFYLHFLSEVSPDYSPAVSLFGY